MNPHIPDTVFVLAMVLLTVAWTPRMTVSVPVANAIGWVVNILAMLALGAVWLR